MASGNRERGGAGAAEADWPLPDTRWTPFYLHRSGVLAPARPEQASGFREYIYDPASPVPTIGGTVTSGQPVMVGGAFDQREGPRFFGSREPYRPLAERADVLVFESAPLEADLEVTGPIVVNLWVSSSAPDTDFTAKLIDVIRIEAFPTSNRFARGHRIRLDISSSNFPHFDANPNTGEPEGRSRTRQVATNRIYLDAGRPSHVVLPVIPTRPPPS